RGDAQTTRSGLVRPDTAKEKPQRGRVLAVGPGNRDEDGKFVGMEIAEGDEVVFSKYGGAELRLGAEEYLTLRESDVLAKVTGETKAKGKSKREPVGASA